MDIDLLSKMVKEIILDNDTVTLPGIGTFVAEIVPSSFSDKGYTINPPYRKLYFSQRENGDTLLVDFYAASNKVSREDASRIITGFLAEMKEVLKVRKTIVFPGLGRLRATRENNFFFVADEDMDIYPAGFGLEPVSLKSHSGETGEEAPEVVPAEEVRPEEMTEALAGEGEEPVEEIIVGNAVVEAVEAQPFVEPEPGPEQGMELEPGPEQGMELEPEPASEDGEEESVPRKKRRAWLAVLVVLLAAVALFLILFVALAHIAPDFIDRLLYSEEELQILHY